MVKIKGLKKTYHMGENVKIKALDNVTLNIVDGELVFIMGKSGSGKSTLLHMMGGLDNPDSGTVTYNDTEITTLKEKKLSLFRRENIGFVFQEFNLIPELTAEENIKYPALLSGKEIDSEFWGYIIKTLGIGDRLSHLPSQLSGGQQQRVAIARAVINNPQVILCDEPTGNLDSQSGGAVKDVLFTLHKQLNKTLIIVTHDKELTKAGGRTIIIKDGKIDGEETYV